MKTTKHLFLFTLLLFLGIHSQIQSQDMPRTVIGSSGDYYQNLLFGNLHWTVGEVAVSRFVNGEELGEGFHRVYYDLLVKTIDPIPIDWKVTVYPNPTADQLKIRFPEGDQVQVQLFSSAGQLVLSDKTDMTETQLDLSALTAGSYWLRLFDSKGRQRSFQVQKIQL